MTDLLIPILAGALGFVVLFGIRLRASDRHKSAIGHLRSSASLLETHETTMREFLASAAAPLDLKECLLAVSNVTGDKTSVEEIALTIVRSNDLAVDEESDVFRAIADLRIRDPDLASLFATSVVSGYLAGLLRWPETASYFEPLTAKLLGGRKKDVAFAVTVSRYRQISLMPDSASFGRPKVLAKI